MDDEDMTPDDIAAIIAAALEDEEVEEVPPTPWSNLDSTAVQMMFAANISLAAADMFRSMALLALGQSAHEFVQQDTKDFGKSVMESLGLIPETKEGEDG